MPPVLSYNEHFSTGNQNSSIKIRGFFNLNNTETQAVCQKYPCGRVRLKCINEASSLKMELTIELKIDLNIELKIELKMEPMIDLNIELTVALLKLAGDHSRSATDDAEIHHFPIGNHHFQQKLSGIHRFSNRKSSFFQLKFNRKSPFG